MIKVLGLTSSGSIAFDKVEVLEQHERANYPSFFEDSTFIFNAPDGVYTVPYYTVSLIQLDSVHRNVPEGYIIKRLTINHMMSYQNAVVIPPEYYDKYKIPRIFPTHDQFAFVTKEGTWITSDYQVSLAQLA